MTAERRHGDRDRRFPVKITNEMVRRAMAAALWADDTGQNRNAMRAILEAALNPKPAEPEIPVSEGMLAVSDDISRKHGYVPTDESRRIAAEKYRAMESQRRKEESEAALGRGGPVLGFSFAGGHERRGHIRATDKDSAFSMTRYHRRKDDP